MTANTTAKDGYNQFKTNTLPGLKDQLKTLEAGQSPKTFFITCSDSRICPNTMTNTSFGELFVVRNAGNTIPAPASLNGNADKATLEYAVQALGVEEIVVCGHSHCGAVGALMSGIDAEKLPYLGDYMNELEPVKKQAQSKGLEGIEVIKENVRMQVQNIMEYSFVKEKVDAGKLKVIGWLYHIENGDVEVVTPAEGA